MSETSTCPQCGSEVSATAKFCTTCGMKLTNTCANCGASLKPTSKFCTECGTPVGGSAPQSPSSTVPTPTADSPEPKEEPSEEVNVKEPTVPKAAAKIDKAYPVPTLAEIKEKGGIIVYDDEDEDWVGKHFLPLVSADFANLGNDDDNELFIKTFQALDNEDTKWKKFGEPGRNVQDYGYPDDDYTGKIEYTNVDNEILILRGSGNTFRILSDEAQKETDENFWILNASIRKIKDKITTILVGGDDISIRARVFKGFKNLCNVILTAGVTGVRTESFADSPVKNLFLPPTLEHIVEGSFIGAEFNCLFFPPLTSDWEDWQIQDDAFVDCKELKYVILPKSLKENYGTGVKDWFKGCNSLDTDNVWDLDDIKDQIEAFEDCANSQNENNNEETTINKTYTLMEEKNLIHTKGDNGKYGYISNGKVVIEHKFEDANEFEEGYACVKLDGKWGYIRPDGSFLIDPKFDHASGFAEGFASVELNGKRGYIRQDGTFLIEPKFDMAYVFREGLAVVEIDHKSGYVKADSSYLIEPIFDWAGFFNGGFATVVLDGKYGYLKSDGTYLFEPLFEWANDLEEGRAKVVWDGKKGEIDVEGNFSPMDWYDEDYDDYGDDDDEDNEDW